MTIPRLALAHLPTPLQHLSAEWLIDLWVKRDDATGGAEAGNKIRKLEYLFAHAQQERADTVVTCGGVQSNHARATALIAARLGMRAKLLLRGDPESVVCGNLLIDRMVGAEIRFCTVEEYAQRDEIMATMGGYIIPEGGSNGRGALGYVEAMREVSTQMDAPFDVVVVACGSGGTAAGCALGAAQHAVAGEVIAIAVCDDAPTFEARIASIMDEARAIDPRLKDPAKLTVDDRFKGPAYAVSSEEQWRSMVHATRETGLVFDPVYSGKAIAAVKTLAPLMHGKRVLYIHTGGLPGALAQASTFSTHFS